MVDVRGYTWPPFESGNEVSTRHGAQSERRVRPLAETLAAEAVEQSPWLGRPTFAAGLAAWSRAEARVLLVSEYLDEHGLLDKDGVPRPTTNYLERVEATAARRRAELGLTPASFVGLLSTLSTVSGADDVLETLRAEGREIRLARTQEAPTAVSAGDTGAEPAADGKE